MGCTIVGGMGGPRVGLGCGITSSGEEMSGKVAAGVERGPKARKIPIGMRQCGYGVLRQMMKDWDM